MSILEQLQGVKLKICTIQSIFAQYRITSDNVYLSEVIMVALLSRYICFSSYRLSLFGSLSSESNLIPPGRWAVTYSLYIQAWPSKNSHV